MRKYRLQKRHLPENLSCLIFTLEQLVVLRKALAPFEQMILVQKKQLPNSDFALEIVKQVQSKLQQMITLNAWDKSVGFDKNEIIILQSSVWMFQLSLETVEPSPETVTLIKQCQHLGSLLTFPSG